MSNDQGPPLLINTFASTWTKDQRVAVASLCVRALDHLAYQNALGEDDLWQNAFLDDLFAHFELADQEGWLVFILVGWLIGWLRHYCPRAQGSIYIYIY